GNPHQALKDKGVIDSGCSRHMTVNISFLFDFEEINRGYVAFGGNPKGGKITGKDIECVVLSSDFKLSDENHVLLRVPRENNMYKVDLKNVVPSGDLTWNQPNDNAGIQENLDAENEKDVHISPSGSDKPKKHNDKDKGNDRGNSPVDLSI
nr:ribonuclease H-like domain-containing protein [Tanacetum cinerariifolium]